MPRPLANLTNLWKVIDWLGDKTSISPNSIKSLFTFCWGFNRANTDKPDFSNVSFQIGPSIYNDASLYWNGVIFIRVMFPFYIGFMFRWSTNRFLQTHIGWKLNGRSALVFRIQTDESAAIGMDFYNHGQAKGFGYGHK